MEIRDNFLESKKIKYLGQFWGGLTVFLSSVYLLKPEVLVQLRHLVENDRGFSILYALLSLVLGLVTIILYNKWKLNWTTIIPVFGWLCILKAFMVLCFNTLKEQAIPSFNERVFITRVLLGIVFIFGAWLYYKSYNYETNKIK